MIMALHFQPLCDVIEDVNAAVFLLYNGREPYRYKKSLNISVRKRISQFVDYHSQ